MITYCSPGRGWGIFNTLLMESWSSWMIFRPLASRSLGIGTVCARVVVVVCDRVGDLLREGDLLRVGDLGGDLARDGDLFRDGGRVDERWCLEEDE